MTTFTKTFASRIEAYQQSNDYDGLCDFFNSETISSLDLIIFYKQKKKGVFGISSFWKSKLPLCHIAEILKSDVKVSFLYEYVKNDGNCNTNLNRQLLSRDPELFLRVFKLADGYKKAAFIRDFQNLLVEFPVLGRLPQEMKVVETTLAKLNLESDFDDQCLLLIPFGKVLITFALFHYEMKQKDRIAGNRSMQVAEEVALVDELNKVICLFQRAGKIDHDSIPFTSDEELQKYFNMYCVPHHILGRSTPQLHDPEIALIRDVLIRKIDRLYQSSPLEIYLSGFAEFENPVFPPYKLVTNDSYKLFQQNDKKSVPEELFLSGRSIARPDLKQMSRTHTTGAMKYFSLYGVPRFIKDNGSVIDLERAIFLLKHLSVYKGPVERKFSPGGVTEMNRPELEFVKMFGSNSCISFYDYNDLIDAIAVYFKCDVETAGNLVDFITIDLNVNGDSTEWIQTPLIKIGDKVIWLGTLLKDRRWEVILTNRLKNIEPYKTKIPKNVEGSVAKLFESRDYFVATSTQFISSTGTKGDIDVIALKDDSLFIIEVKAGQNSNDFKHAAYSELIRLEGTAAEQLDKIENYIRTDWDIFKQKLGKWKYRKIEELTIYSLIVTNYFEGDLQLYKERYLKTSILELEVILSNSKKKLYENYFLLNAFTNLNNHDRLGQGLRKVEWNLWKNKISPQLLYECISNNSVWKELKEEWKFENQVFYVE